MAGSNTNFHRTAYSDHWHGYGTANTTSIAQLAVVIRSPAAHTAISMSCAAEVACADLGGIRDAKYWYRHATASRAGVAQLAIVIESPASNLTTLNNGAVVVCT